MKNYTLALNFLFSSQLKITVYPQLFLIIYALINLKLRGTRNLLSFKKLFKKKSTIPDGILDSINICLNNYKSKKYKNMLEYLTKPEFIRKDEKFQELLHLIIAGYS